VTGTVVSYVDEELSLRLVLTDVSIDGVEEEGILNAYLPYSNTKNMHIADVVVITGRVRTDTKYFNDERFKGNAINDKVRFVLSDATSFQKVGRSKDVFLRIRARADQMLSESMDKTSAAVTFGILMGDTTKIESDLLDNMRYGGIAHIFAVSGLHVGALYAFILLLFSKTALKKLPAVCQFISLTAILLFYAGICGFSPSIVRAMTLCLVGYFMRKLGGRSDGLNTLGLSAILILLITPCALFEIGFQLSFAACLGILLFSKRIGQVCDEGKKLFRKIFPRRYTEEEKEILKQGDTLPLSVGERIFRAFSALFSASLAAQVFTAPLQYMAFGYLSGWALLFNLLFVPLISGMFAMLLLLVFLACALPLWLGSYLLYIPMVLFHAVLLVFEVADLSAFALTGMQLSGESCVCYYGGMIFLTDKWNVSKKQSRLLASLFFVGFVVILAMLNL
jgi:competence protein ComEC